MRNLLFHPISVVVITILALLYFFSLRTTIKRATQPSETVSELKQEVSNLTSEVSELAEEVETSKTEFAKEMTVRDELLMLKPGEYVIQLGESVVVPIVEPTPSATPTPWEEWKVLLF